MFLWEFIKETDQALHIWQNRVGSSLFRRICINLCFMYMRLMKKYCNTEVCVNIFVVNGKINNASQCSRVSLRTQLRAEKSLFSLVPVEDLVIARHSYNRIIFTDGIKPWRCLNSEETYFERYRLARLLIPDPTNEKSKIKYQVRIGCCHRWNRNFGKWRWMSGILAQTSQASLTDITRWGRSK